MKYGLLEYLFSRRWPVYLVTLSGLVFAIVRWKRHPKISLLTISGLFLLLAQSLAFGTIFYLLPTLNEQGVSYGTINILFFVLQILRDLIYSFVLVLLVSAAFSQRGVNAT